MNLLQLQSAFQDALLNPSPSEPNWIRNTPAGLPAPERMNIYHGAYRARLVDVLRDTYAHTAVYLGDDWFDQVAAQYVETCPSTQHNIGHYGREFSEHLALEHPDDPDIAELARMDWTLRRTFDGPDSTVMTSADLAQIPADSTGAVCLVPVPTMRVMRQHCNTLAIWQAINNEQQPPLAEPLATTVDILCWRRDHSPHYRSIEPFEAAAIAAISSGQTLDETGLELQQEFPETDAATAFGALLVQWLNAQLLSGWSVRGWSVR